MKAETKNAQATAVILFGSPGSGKGTQAKLLRKGLGWPHISTGDMLRTHIGAGDEIGHQAEQLIKSGRLVPDELVNQLVKTRLAQPDCRAGVILDGYPRTLNQASVLLDITKQTGFRPVVVHLVVDYEKIVARLSGRRQCPVCGTLYNLVTNPPKVDTLCDLEGALLVTRKDDHESVIRERLSEYDLQTVPLLEYFREAGVSVMEVNGGDGTPEQIVQQICEGLAESGSIERRAADCLRVDRIGPVPQAGARQ